MYPDTKSARPASIESISAAYAALDPVMEELVGEVRRSLDSFAKTYPDRPVTRLHGLGGGFQLHGLLRYLQIGR